MNKRQLTQRHFKHNAMLAFVLRNCNKLGRLKLGGALELKTRATAGGSPFAIGSWT